MRGTVGLRLLLCVVTLCGAAWAPCALAAPARQDLVAHGSGERFWVARVSPPDPAKGASAGVRTAIYVRSVGESHWAPVRQVEARVVAMAHRGPQLALLLDDGRWLLASEDTLVTGRPLPGGAAMLDLATNGESLLALARLRPPSLTTAAATTASSSTGPMTSPDAAYRLALFSLGPSGWAETGDLGVTTAAARADVSLAVVNGAAAVALRDSVAPQTIRLRRQAPDHSWQAVGSVDLDRDATAFQLLGGGPVPVLWSLARDGGYTLTWFGPEGPKAEAVPSRPGTDPSEVAAAIAIERVRVVYTADGKQFERTFDTMPPSQSSTAPSSSGHNAARASDEARVLLPAGSLNPLMFQWVRPLLTVALLFTVVASLRRHRQMQDAMSAAHKLHLAPPGRRLAAGVIDAAPLLAAALVVWVRDRRMDDPSGLWDDTTVRVALAAGVAAYFLHTTLTEVALGRTIGKIVCGLRVVGLDGGRPSAGALAARNLLRVIDLLIAFFPLVLVLYSPLRQRAGDVAAGTLVIVAGPRSEAEAAADDEPPKAGPSGAPGPRDSEP